MPITRKQISAAASTSNPPNKNIISTNVLNGNINVSKLPIPVSDDDLFEQSAIQVQVSSASRQTRTINHQIPKEVRKRLHSVFTAASHNHDQKEEIKTIEDMPLSSVIEPVKFSKNTSKTSLAPRTLVKRSFSNLNIKGNIVGSSKEYSTVEPIDSIFEVPISPSPPRENILCSNSNTTTETNFNHNNSLFTPSKTFANRLLGLASPARNASNQIIAEIRRTPLTMAEKKKRQASNAINFDSISGTNIAILKGIDVEKEKDINDYKAEREDDKAVCDSEIDLDLGSIISRSKNRIRRKSKIRNDLIIIDENGVDSERADDDSMDKKSKFKVLESKNNLTVNNFEELTKTKIPKILTENCDIKHNQCQSSVNNENKDSNLRSNESTTIMTKNTINATKTKQFVRNESTSESAPPDLTETLIFTSKPKRTINFENNSLNNIKICDESISKNLNDISLVIEVPPPPKLEDLESLDPELYVKLKSGSLKDDCSVPFISESDRLDIENFLDSFTSPELTKNMLPVAIIGEGTFSTVYKVIDKKFYACDNSGWLEYSRQNPLDWLRLWRWIYEREGAENNFVLFRDGKRCVDRTGKALKSLNVHPNTISTNNKPTKDKLSGLLKRYLLEWAMCSLDSLLPHPEPSESVLSSITPRALQSAMLRFRPYFTALKRINSTSSPQRILDEMSFLRHLGGKNNVVPIINGIRCEDQVLVAFPYFYCEEFREFLSNTNSLTIKSIACYMKALFISLAHLHAHSVIHRDVKPSNFLYAPENGGRGVLLDFGLAQKESRSTSTVSKCTNISSITNVTVSGSKVLTQITPAQRNVQANRNTEKERKKIQAVNQILNTLNPTVNGVHDGLDNGEKCEKLNQLIVQLGPGYFNNDPRAGMKASRAGTRGFRAPEVLFKCSHQTTALDIWSAGVIFLTLLTRRYPFFQSSDDFDAIIEIANIFGNEEIAGAAKMYGRRWKCVVPSVPEKHVGWSELCEKLNPPGFDGEKVPRECLDLLRESLNLDSSRRITARAALKHQFIQKYAK